MKKEQLNYFEKICYKNQSKVTPQRLEIYKQILKLEGHPTVEEIYQKIKKNSPHLSLDTIYRNIALFEEWGLLKKVNISGKASCFEKNVKEHYHFCCKKCNMLFDFELDFQNYLKKSKNLANFGEIQSSELIVYGICKKCV